MWLLFGTLMSAVFVLVEVALLVLLILDFESIVRIMIDGNGECNPDRYGPFVCFHSFQRENDNASFSSIFPLPYRISSGVIYVRFLGIAIVLLSLTISFVIVVVTFHNASKIIRYNYSGALSGFN